MLSGLTRDIAIDLHKIYQFLYIIYIYAVGGGFFKVVMIVKLNNKNNYVISKYTKYEYMTYYTKYEHVAPFIISASCFDQVCAQLAIGNRLRIIQPVRGEGEIIFQCRYYIEKKCGTKTYHIWISNTERKELLRAIATKQKVMKGGY